MEERGRTMESHVRDLAAVLALPAMWKGRDPTAIAAGMLDALSSLLRLEAAHARLSPPPEGCSRVDASWPSAAAPTLPALTDLARAAPDDQGLSVAPLDREAGGEGVRAVALIQDVLGARLRVAVAARRPDFPLDTERFLLRVAVEQAAIAIEGTTVLARAEVARRTAERAAERTRHLQEITGQLSRSLEAEQVLESVARSAAELIGAPVGAVFLLGAPDGDFELAAAHGVDASAGQLRLPRGASLAGRAVDQRRTLVVDDVSETAGTALPELLIGQTAGSEMAAPIFADDEPLGVVKIFSPTVRRFAADDAALLTALAAAAAVALNNARLYRQVQDALRARDEFLSTAAHDLKTPLTSIKGTAQFLRRQATGPAGLAVERLVEGLSGLDESATRISRQVDQLLDITRLQAGQPLELQRRPTDLVALARRAAAEHQSAAPRHAIDVDAQEAELVGLWDRPRIERVLDNLLSNAVKYSPEGGRVLLRVQCDGQWAVLTVRDTGIGIPAADLPRIFERFHRAANAERVFVGSGLGLASTRQIVEQHHGSIAVDSVEGRGTTFTVRLPLTDAEGGTGDER